MYTFQVQDEQKILMRLSGGWSGSHSDCTLLTVPLSD
jgi:hypothetical protein